MLISDGAQNSYEHLSDHDYDHDDDDDYDHQSTNVEFLSKKYLSRDFESSAESNPETDIKLEHTSHEGS